MIFPRLFDREMNAKIEALIIKEELKKVLSMFEKEKVSCWDS